MVRLPAACVVLVTLALVGEARAEGALLTADKSIYADERNKPLAAPEGVACTDAGELFVADTGNGRILRYSYKKGVVDGGKELAGSPLKYPVRLAIDGRGGLIVLDAKRKSLGRFDETGAFTPIDVVDPAGGKVFVGAFKLGPGDAIYAVDVEKHGVIVADAAGRVLRRLPAPPGAAFTDVAVDVMGTVYAMDAIAARLFAAKSDEKALVPVGASLKGFMSFPVYLTHRGGRIDVIDQHGGGIVTVGTDGVFHGRQLALGWSEGLLYYPSQTCMTASGELFVADRGNNRVQIFTVSQ